MRKPMKMLQKANKRKSLSIVRKLKKEYVWDFDSKKADNLEKYVKKEVLR